MNLYLTADKVGLPTGGGAVTYHESMALSSVAPCEVWDREVLGREDGFETWKYDINAFHKARHQWGIGAVRQPGDPLPELIHCYAGTFSQLISNAKFNNIPVTYTAAAHDVVESRKEHEKLGIPYNYPHLTDPALWERYLGGYKAADVLICPSQHSAQVMRNFGCSQRIEVIPHGCELPNEVQPQPPKFVVGYLGAIGPDKGLLYLLEAWHALDYKDGSTLVIAGHHSQHPMVNALLDKTDCLNVQQLGWVPNVSDFYNNISLYVQPSVTEGFGMEVLEALAHNRPVVCSTGAGAADLVPSAWTFMPRDVEELAAKIDLAKHVISRMQGQTMTAWRQIAERFTWDKIRAMYVKVWRELLEG